MRHINLIIFSLCVFVNKSEAFNLDLGSFIRHGGSPNSMFGFSIALHKHITNWIIVGAPRTNTSYYQPGVERGGAVYKCDIQDDNRCLMVPFDSKGNQFNDRGEQIDSKSNQWLGAAVSSGGENGPVVACAPRYVFHTMQPRRVERIEPVGTCFTSSKDFTVFTEYSPCRTNYWGYHRQGSCQAGFSAALSKKGDRLFIGAPGSWYWQGQMFSINTDAKFPYKPPLYQDFGAGGQTYSYDITDRRNNVYSTGESYSSDDDSYLGYSMITGDFNGDGDEDVAVGMPRGAGLLGKIVLFKWNAVNQLNITGRQIGAYFGYSLCSVDVDGDELDDLIIGAPMYTIPNNEEKYDVGRVYIMLQGKNAKFEKISTRDGFKTKGRFGLSLTTLGDINLDGYGDFAIGAPYDGDHERGAVYIFHGSRNGALPKHSQVIYAEDVVGPPYPRTFGFSLAGGMDLDGNLYPDLAVGAYESDSVLVFKSRPVAVVDASTTFSTVSKLLSLDDKKCITYRDAKRVTCTEINSCLKYTGTNLPSVLDFEISWVLDVKKLKTPRMFFLLDEGKNVRNSTMRLERGKLLCRNETVFIADNIRDKLTPLEVEMRYQLRGITSKPVVRRKRDILEPVIDQNRDIVQRDSINIQKNCGSDNLCVPDLQLNIVAVDKYLLGSTAPLEIDVLVSNFGEDAFEASFYMVLPEDLDFTKIQQIGNVRDTPITCTAPSISTNYTLKCDIGNPLAAGKVANFKVITMPSQKTGMAPSYEFFMEANSTNLETDGSKFDNIIRKSISIWIQTDLAIEGFSVPEFDHYKASEYKSYLNSTSENDLGPQVVHIYNIRNNGPSVIEEAEVYIHWPYKTENGDTLMYMVQEPYTDGNIRCDPSIHVNPRNLHLDVNLASKNYLESSGAIVKNFEASNSYQTGVRIDKSSSHSTFPIHETGTANRNLTASEKRRLAEEENMESVGDASLVHNQRAQDASAASSYGNYEVRNSYEPNTWNLSSTNDGRPIFITRTRNRTITIDDQGNEHTVESSTETVGLYNSQNRQYSSGASAHHSTNKEYAYSPNSGFSTQYISPNLGKIDQDRYEAGTIGLNTLGRTSLEDELSSRNKQNLRGHSQDTLFTSQYQDENVHSPSTNQRFIPGDDKYQGDYNNKDMNYGTRHSHTHQSSANGNRQNIGEYSSANANRQNIGDLENEYNNKDMNYESRHSSSHTHQSSGSGSRQNMGEYSSANANRQNIGDLENEYNNKDMNYESRHSSSHTHQSSASGNRQNVEEHNQDYRRHKRNLNSLNDFKYDTPCKSKNCGTMRCFVSNLRNNEGAWLAIRTRLVAATMKHLSENIPLNVSTMAVAHVTKLPYIGLPKDNLFESHEIFYKAIPEPIPSSDMVPLWIVVLSACAGVIILLLLVFLLYKCGFFKRNRPSDNSQERQPLNSRNGYHGDEHL